MRLSVLFNDIVDHFPAAIHAKVHVDIRHGDTFGVEEAFKEQIVGEGIEVRNSKGIRHKASGGRSSPGADRNVAGSGEIDDIPHNQKISGIPHGVQHSEFGVEALLVRLGWNARWAFS